MKLGWHGKDHNLNVKAVAAVLNQEKQEGPIAGTFSMIVRLKSSRRFVSSSTKK